MKHVIGRRPKYPNTKREAVKTDTVLPHTVVSGLHCMIWREWDPDAPGDASLAIAYLEDHSTNGTFVNGEKIKQQRIAIGDGDDISLGQIVTGRELASEFRKLSISTTLSLISSDVTSASSLPRLSISTRMCKI